MNKFGQLWFEKVKKVFVNTFMFVVAAFFVLVSICVIIGLLAWVAKLVFKIDTPDWLQNCENLFLAEHRVGIFDVLIVGVIGAVIASIVSFIFALVYALVLAIKNQIRKIKE